jgi:hypothetical protein
MTIAKVSSASGPADPTSVWTEDGAAGAETEVATQLAQQVPESAWAAEEPETERASLARDVVERSWRVVLGIAAAIVVGCGLTAAGIEIGHMLTHPGYYTDLPADGGPTLNGGTMEPNK